MKKTQRSHNSTLNNVGKGSSFKHRRHKEFMAYLGRLRDRMPCDVCGRVDWYRTVFANEDHVAESLNFEVRNTL